ncbi:hypothetical protein ABZ924_33385 [Streptomyces sp. NPDC046876]|uniref:hypothetical protein n=1 Tax=Streptomyces sp. NPDC046876 TaxID=3155616 RepID=UPI0033C6DA70
MLLNSVSGRLDEAAFEAMRGAAVRFGLPFEEIAAGELPGYRPLDNDRALRAAFLPREV